MATAGTPWRQRRRRRGRAEPIHGPPLIDRALRRLGLLEAVHAQQALRAFSLACGPQLSPRARGERFAHGVLTVRVSSSAWANEISFAKAPLLSKIRKTPGGEKVRDVRFTVGPIDELDVWQAPVKPVPDKPEIRRGAKVDPRVAAALTQVDNDELREALGALYVSACHAAKRKK